MIESQLFALAGPLEAVNPLPPVTLPPLLPDAGPYLKVQFVIELVGREMIPAQAAQELLRPKAKAGLGEPEVYVMSPGQTRWRPLWTGDDAIAYDSLAFAWDLVSTKGQLSQVSAAQLLERASKVGSTMNRRAVPLRPLEDIDEAVENLREVQESLDIGFDAAVLPEVDSFDTLSAVRAAYGIGYRLGDSGLLEWRQGGWPEALLTLYPLGSATEFDPRRWPKLSGIGIGFSVPCCPAPKEVLERLLSTLDSLAASLGGAAKDEDGNVLDVAARAGLGQAMDAATTAFQQVGLQPGSPEALRLFEP